MLKPKKGFVQVELNIERLTQIQWDGIMRAMEAYAEHYHEEQVEKLNIPAVSNNEVAVAFGEWLRTQRADVFYGSPTTEHLFEIYKKATDC